MRRTQRQQAEQGIQLLEQAHREIREQIEKQKTETAEKLLEQCQQYAIALGQMIEKEEGEGTAAVRLLEEYCEQVYQIYQEAEQLQPRDAKHAYRKLCQAVLRLKDSVRELPVRTEAVFLPYKASMWDSLESIWMAACEDPACDAYVIPIPYYDKHPDGSLGELHDESGLYPEYVPVTGYREYSFAERRPDLIFIHNPYDAYNYLTSVHPFFYAENLKKFTEKLVYVPYFVLEEPDPDDPAQVEGISHFCTTSGVLYADKVIVQSEKMRQVYVKVMTEFTKGHGMTRKYWEEKILGLGSPKLDRVRTAQKEAWELPEKWRKMIQKPDGSRKKVILYNTGLTAFLQHSSIYLDKVRDVFRIFREKQEEAALLWRPHPLLHATAKTMRPEVLEDYEKLLEEYRIDGFGIYDDSADLNRAIAVCDAYYGDSSSVVQLCREAGKPVLLQNVEMLLSEQEEELLDKPLIFENGYDDGTSLWFTEFDYNSLMKMDKRTHGIQWKGVFPDEPFTQERLYSDLAMCDGKLYFAPYMANEIAVYDRDTGKLWKIPLRTPVKKNTVYHEKFHFFRAISIEKMIYFIPECYPGILCYDTEHNVFRCFDDWVDEIEGLRVSKWRYFTEFVLADHRLILPCSCADAVVIFDLTEEKSWIVKTSSTEYLYKFCGICRVADELYLVSADGTVSKRKINDIEQEIKRWKLPVSGMDDIEFYPVRNTEDAVWLFPFRSNCAHRIDIKTDKITPITILDDERTISGYLYSCLFALQSGNQWYLSAGNSRRFLEFNMENEEKQVFELFLRREDRELLKKCKRKDFVERIRKAVVTESDIDSLRELLSTSKFFEISNKENVYKGKLENGRRIYQAL